MVRAVFFHVAVGATHEIFTDSWTRHTSKEKAGGAMLDDAEMCQDDHLEITEGCCGQGGRRVQGEEEGDGWTRNKCTRTRTGLDSCHKEARRRRPHLLVRHPLRLLNRLLRRAIGLLVDWRGPSDQRFFRRGPSGTTTASRKRRLPRSSLHGVTWRRTPLAS